MIFMLAGNETEATDYAASHSMEAGSWIYLDVMLRLRGKGYGPQHTMLFVGAYESNPLYAEALSYAQRGEFVIEYGD